MEALKKNAMNFGLILGLFLVVLTTAIYSIDLALLTKPWVGIFNVFLITSFGIIATTKFKKCNGGFITFKEAFTSFFIAIALGLLLSTLFTILLFNFIDTDAKNSITEKVVKYTVEMMQKFGAKAADINKMIAEMEKSDSFGVLGQIKGYAFNLVLYCIIGLISAAVIKREVPQSN